MRQTPLRTAALAAAVVIVIWAALLLNLWVKSDRTPIAEPPVKADAASIDSLAQSIRDEVPVDKLTVQEVEGIVIIRGKTRDQNVIARVSQLAKDRGFGRVANLVQFAPGTSDQSIEREAERTLAQTPELDGCRFAIDSVDGIVTLSGVVQRELQKDLARDLLRRVPGVKEVRAELRIQT